MQSGDAAGTRFGPPLRPTVWTWPRRAPVASPPRTFRRQKPRRSARPSPRSARAGSTRTCVLRSATRTAPVREADAAIAATPRGRIDPRARESPVTPPSRASPRGHDTRRHTPRSRPGDARCDPWRGLRGSNTESGRLRRSASLVTLYRFRSTLPGAGVPERLQRLAQLFHGTEHAVLGRAGAEPERFADFVDRPSFVVAERKGGALQRAHQRQGVLHLAIDFGAFSERLRIRHLGRGKLRRCLQRLAADLIVPGLAGTHQIHRAVRRDPVEPRAEVRARLEPAKLAVRPQKALLDHIFGILLIARHPERQPEDTPAVPLDKCAKGVAVALAGPRQDGSHFGRVHHPQA